MRQLLVLTCILLLSGSAPAAKNDVALSDQERVLHALNRLAFGSRPGQVEQVHAMGLKPWIQQQLHPDTVPETPQATAKVAPFATQFYTPAQMLEAHPNPGLIRLMAYGEHPLPNDPEARALVEAGVVRNTRYYADKDVQQKARENPKSLTPLERLYLMGKRNDDMFQASMNISNEERAEVERKSHYILALARLHADDRPRFDKGTPEQRIAILEPLPVDAQIQLLMALTAGERRRMLLKASPVLRRRIEKAGGPRPLVQSDAMNTRILRAVYSERQLQEVLADFWFNHFNVYIPKTTLIYAPTRFERDAIRPHIFGNFQDMLVAVSRSTAMLVNLDNYRSAIRGYVPKHDDIDDDINPGLNENFAREVMELHTLGVDGGYTQKDVTEAARCFTGWTIPSHRGPRWKEFGFDVDRHDKGEKTVLGMKFPANGGVEEGMRILEFLAHHPSTARHVSRKLAIRFVSDDPPQSLVDRMAKQFLATGGDLRKVYETMLESPEFWSREAYRAKIKTPYEMVISALRASNADIDYPIGVLDGLNELGQPLLQKLEPCGYSDKGSDWVNSGSVVARINFATALLNNRIAGVSVAPAQFKKSDNPLQDGLAILAAPPSPATVAAIRQALQGAGKSGESKFPHMVAAGMAVASPDFQRH